MLVAVGAVDESSAAGMTTRARRTARHISVLVPVHAYDAVERVWGRDHAVAGTDERPAWAARGVSARMHLDQPTVDVIELDDVLNLDAIEADVRRVPWRGAGGQVADWPIRGLSRTGGDQASQRDREE
jgi:hypothetical protein